MRLIEGFHNVYSDGEESVFGVSDLATTGFPSNHARTGVWKPFRPLQIGTICAMESRGERPQLDAINKKIMVQLQEDGRRSYVSIGKAVGLSEAAVRLRVQKMIDEGLMQIVAVTNPLELGYKRQAMVGITVNGDIEYVARQLRDIRQIDYIVITTGRYDILAELFSEDDESMLEVVNRHIRKIDGIARTELFTYMRLEMQRYDWGVW